MLTRLHVSNNSRPIIAMALLTILSALLTAAAWPAALGSTTISSTSLRSVGDTRLDASNLPFQFERNVGQSDPQAQFIAHAPGSTFFFTRSGIVLSLSAPNDPTGSKAGAKGNLATTNGVREAGATLGQGVLGVQAVAATTSDAVESFVTMSFVGTASEPGMTGGALLPGTVNYLLGSDSSRWLTNLPAYGDVTYTGLYPGIDLKYDGSGGQLKGTYMLGPGADPSLIQWRYNANSSATAPKIDISSEGALQVLVAGAGKPVTITEHAPVAWQEVGGERVEVRVSYIVTADGTVGFSLGKYDHARPLTIDPTLTYSTYFGGIIADLPTGMAMDAQGNSYVTGYTASNNFPTVNALQPVEGGQGDAFVLKFNSNGVPVYSTYLGGNYVDYGGGIAADTQGNAYVTGWTGSSNFPTVSAFQPTYAGNWDAFVAKISADGSALVYSTYLGGSAQENYSTTGEIAVDAGGNAYITGDTQSANFPTHNAYQPQHASTGSTDLFVTKLSAGGQSLIYSTYLGGAQGGESGLAIAADASGYAYLTGYTTSTDFPVSNAYQPTCYFGAAGCWDAFVTKFSLDGQSLVYSTYLGGNDIEYIDKGAAITPDGAGNVYVTGMTGSPNFPVLNAYQPAYGGQIDTFVSKFSSAGALLYSSFLGGNNSDVGGAITLDYLGNIYIGGLTLSANFPVVNAIQPTMGGFEDAFVTKFNAGGQSLDYSTYLGGTNDREEYGIAGIGVDGEGTAYVVGSTSARDFPTVNAYQPFNNGSYDLFFAKISDPIGPTPTNTATPAGTATATPTVCAVSDYSIAQSTGASIVPGATLLPNSICQDCTAPMVLPFPVQLYNQTFTVARASSNGNLQFTSDNHLPFNSALPNATYNNAIFAYWDDLNTDCTGCGIYTSISGSAPNRIFNIEWRTLRNEPPVVNVRFEIRLYENSNGRFDIVYGQLDNPGDSATVGVQYSTGSRFTQYSYNSGTLSQGLKLSFTLPPCQVGTSTPTPVGPTPTNTPPPMPTLLYSTYFGSWERDSIQAIGKDAAGNIYVAGTTFDIDFNYGDIMVAKFTPNGQTLLWRRLIGGTRIDYGYALAVDAAGNATVAGIATSVDYPTVNAIQPTHHGGIYDGVLTKLDPQGNTLFSTYLGGSGTDYADGLATDSAGNVYLTGHTNSSNFPTTAGAFQTTNQGQYDGYVTKIAANGSAIVWSTYVGGLYSDESHAITVDSVGNTYLTGWTVSPNFPTLNAFQPAISDNSGDAFVTKLNPSGSGLVYSTYLGGNNPPGPGEDNGRGIVVDTQGYAYVTGYTQAANFPTTSGSYQPFFRGYYDAFVTKFTPSGTGLVYSTYLGGSVNPPYGDDEAFGIAVDGQGQAVITGKTYSPDFPVLNAVQPTLGGVYDAFVTKFNAAGSALVYSTYLGGNYHLPNFSGDDAGTGVLIDGSGNAVVGGGTASDSFPVANAYQPENAGEGDGFIAKISGSAPATTPTVVPSASPTSPATSPTTTRPATATATPGGPTVTATPSATACAITFSDVQPGSTFYSYIQCLACGGIVSGYPDSTFRPGNPVTRGQAAKIVANSAGYSESIPPTRQTFTDVLPGSTFWVYIERVAMHGAINGYPDGTYRPNNNVTRGQLSKIDAEVKGYNDAIPLTQQTFADVVPNSTFWVYIERVALHGVVSGYPDGTFRPNNNVTRGQAAKIVSNTFFPGCTPAH